VKPTTEKIDVEKLKVRDKIHFYADILLFEDELSDNGCSVLRVKIVSNTCSQKHVSDLYFYWQDTWSINQFYLKKHNMRNKPSQVNNFLIINHVVR